MTLIEGDGIGPEISQGVKDIFAVAKVGHLFSLAEQGIISIRPQLVGNRLTSQHDSKTERLSSLTRQFKVWRRTILLWKDLWRYTHGALDCRNMEHKLMVTQTPVGKGHVSLNLTFRRRFNIFANVWPCKSIAGYKTPYDNVDAVLIPEIPRAIPRNRECCRRRRGTEHQTHHTESLGAGLAIRLLVRTRCRKAKDSSRTQGNHYEDLWWPVLEHGQED